MIVNITSSSDADFIRRFFYSEDEAAQVPINLVGQNLLLVIRKRATDNSAVLRLDTQSSGGMIYILGSASGEVGYFDIDIPFEIMRNMPPGEYAHALIRIDGDGRRHRVWSGAWVHEAGAAR